jgi:hypothetical protein
MSNYVSVMNLLEDPQLEKLLFPYSRVSHYNAAKLALQLPLMLNVLLLVMPVRLMMENGR